MIKKEIIHLIIEKLEILKKIEELEFTDWNKTESTEDRLESARNYIECGNLIKLLNNELNG